MKALKTILSVYMIFLCSSTIKAQCNASFSISVSQDTITLLNTSLPTTGATYKWIAPALTFINNTDSSSKNPMFKAWVKGEYLIRLIVSNASGSCIDTSTLPIVINLGNWCSMAHADFKYNLNNGVLELEEQCVPTYVPKKDLMFWHSFSEKEHQRNRTHEKLSTFNQERKSKFAAPDKGLYGIYLFYYNTRDLCYDSIIRVFDLDSATIPCKANFSHEYISSAQSFYFYDSSSITRPRNSIRTWTFGDGTTLTQPYFYPTTTHKYSTTGNFNVCLKVEDTINHCKDSVCKMISLPKFCGADFYTFINNNGKVFFQNISGSENPSNTNYLWDFGDGQTSTVKQPPAHTYTTNGTYTTCLYIHDTKANCKDTICKTITIPKILGGPSCRVQFYAQRDLNGTVHFNPRLYSGGSFKDFVLIWKFHDGVLSNTQKPVRQYLRKGTYNVCLYVEDTVRKCRDTVCKDIYIPGNFVSNTGCKANGNFDTFNFSFSKSFTDLSIVNDTNNVVYQWTFGDGNSSKLRNVKHPYAAPGKYNVCLTIHDTVINCKDSICDSVEVLSQTYACSIQPNFKISPLNGKIVEFSATTSGVTGKTLLIWDFGDGTPFSWGNQPKHVYSSAGSYNVCVRLYDKGSSSYCADTSCIQVGVLTSISSYATEAFDIFPNPSNGQFTIQSPMGQVPELLEVYDLTGAKLLTHQPAENGGRTTIDLSHVPDGLYILNVILEGQIIPYKLMKSNR